MIARILLDPEPTAGGGAPAAEAPAPPQQQPAPAAPPAYVQVTPDQFKGFLDAQSRLSQIEAERAQRDAEAASERQKLLVEKGQIQEAWDLYKGQVEPQLESQRQRAERYQRQLHAEAMGRAVAEGFAGVAFVSESAKAQALRHAASLLEVHEDAQGNLAVRQPGTGIASSEFLRAQVASPEFAHFLKADTKGGSGSHLDRPHGAPGTAGHEPPAGDINALLLAQMRANRFEGVPGTARYNQRNGVRN